MSGDSALSNMSADRALSKLKSAIGNCAFALETVAHLQSREKELLPYAEDVRESLDKYLRSLGVQPELPF